jgi:hypothetical protein
MLGRLLVKLHFLFFTLSLFCSCLYADETPKLAFYTAESFKITLCPFVTEDNLGCVFSIECGTGRPKTKSRTRIAKEIVILYPEEED